MSIASISEFGDHSITHRNGSSINGRDSLLERDNTQGTQTMIGRLHNHTFDGQVKDRPRNQAGDLLHKIVSILRRNDLDVQLLNGLRFECMRADRQRK